MGTGEIPAELAATLAAHSLTACEFGAALTPAKRSGRGIHSFLAHLKSGVDPVPGLDRVTVVRVDPDRRVHLMHSLFSFRVELYSTQPHLFAGLGNLPPEGLPPVAEIPDEAFAARHSVRFVPQVDPVTHLGRISPSD